MAFTRVELAVKVGMKLKTLLDAAELTAADDAENLMGPIDDALDVLAVSTEPGVEILDKVGAIALTTRNTLLIILDRQSGNFDISTQGNSFKLNQLLTNAEAMLARVEQELFVLFGTTMPVGGTNSASMVLYTGSNYRASEAC